MNCDNFCKHYHNVTRIPVLHFQADHIVQVFGISEDLCPSSLLCGEILKSKKPVSVYESPANFLYGLVRIEKDAFALGPLSVMPANRSIVTAYLNENMIEPALAEDIRSLFSDTPRYTLGFITSALSLFYQGLTGEELIIETADLMSVTSNNAHVLTDQVKSSYEDKEDRLEHGTFYFESQLLSYVRDGNVGGLITFLKESAATQSFREGTVAPNPLRQAKNIFLALVARMGKDGAIPGGMDIEEAYHLIDSYSQQCERLTSVREINELNYHMLLEFAERTAKAKLPAGLSDETYGCIIYINSHLNEPLCVEDIAASCNRSVSYISKKFKKELGFSVGQYIIHARINEAKSLLLYSEKSLSEIASYLCFSSQPYFQNVFKQVTGQTPLEYRKNQRQLGWSLRTKEAAE